MSAARVARAAALTALVSLALPCDGSAQPPGDAISARATVSPDRAPLGAAVHYRGVLVVPRPLQVRWIPPDTAAAVTWGPLVPRRGVRPSGAVGGSGDDTVEVRATLQVFEPGVRMVPGLQFTTRLSGGALQVHRLPSVRLEIVPSPGAADSSAELHAVRGIGAPWWERVPWRWVLLAIAILAALVWLIRAWRRRARKAAPVTAGPARDPGTIALEELAALRRMSLPEHGRFGEHAFHLTRILRRYLEATTGALHPGDTTPEVVGHLAGAPLDPAELQRLDQLLHLWDRLKFARGISSVDEARAAEGAVEALVRRRDVTPSSKVA